jgi:hypothetical protein
MYGGAHVSVALQGRWNYVITFEDQQARLMPTLGRQLGDTKIKSNQIIKSDSMHLLECAIQHHSPGWQRPQVLLDGNVSLNGCTNVSD